MTAVAASVAAEFPRETIDEAPDAGIGATQTETLVEDLKSEEEEGVALLVVWHHSVTVDHSQRAVNNVASLLGQHLNHQLASEIPKLQKPLQAGSFVL